MNQRGFFQLSLAAWVAIGVGAVVLVLGVAVKVQTQRLEAVKKEYATFKGGAAALGEQAKAAAARQALHDLKNKERTDDENARRIADFRAAIAQLRDERDRARGGFVSAATSCPASPDAAAEFRAEYQRAYGALVAGLRGLGDEGSKAVIDLDSAKAWARGHD